MLTRRDTLMMAGLALPLASTAIAAPPADKKYLILSCDGGGIRGVLTAKIIERLQEEVPFLDQVELFAGTSTGGIIALGLAHGVTPKDLVALYRDQGPKIFPKNEIKRPTLGFLKDWDWLGSVTDTTIDVLKKLPFQPQDLLHPKYPNKWLSDELTKIFHADTLADLKRPALVTTLRLCSTNKSWAPLVLHNLDLGGRAAAQTTRLQDDPRPTTKLVDAALATSAAPLYFPPHDCPGFGYCVDGGLFANCPASIAMGLALRADPGRFQNLRILSIGTGRQISGIDIVNSSPFTKPADYGALAWLDPIPRGKGAVENDKLTPAFPLISALFDASSASHDYICEQALPDKYLRVQVDLPRPIDLDATDEESLKSLEAAAASIPAKEWNDITGWLNRQLA